jgi:hypothetical protein
MYARELHDRRRIADEQDVLEARQRGAERFDLFAIEGVGRDEHLRARNVDARLNRLGSERGEEGREDAAVLERAERGDVELRNPAGEHGNRVPLSDTERAQDAGEAARFVAEVAIREIAPHALF